MLQIGGPWRHAYIKFRDPQRMREILTVTQRQEDFRQENGEISKVRIEAVRLGIRRVRVASLPSELEDKTLKMALGAFGEIRDIQPEIWSNAYHYWVSTVVCVVIMLLSKHIPSHVVVAGYRSLISYEGQPTTCYSCNEPVHPKTTCPHRRRERAEGRPATTASWAEVAARGIFETPRQRWIGPQTWFNLKIWRQRHCRQLIEPPRPRSFEIAQRVVEVAPAKEKERVLETTTVTPSERP